MTFPDMRARATALARKGLRVFPLIEGQKTPAVEQFYEHASCDVERVYRWWTEAIGDGPEHYNIGVLTGQGLVVLDIDMKQGKNGRASLQDLQDNYGVLPGSYAVKTPSGGYHIYFALPDGVFIPNSAGTLGDGLDVRGFHGFVVGAGSVTEQGEYTETTAEEIL